MTSKRTSRQARPTGRSRRSATTTRRTNIPTEELRDFVAADEAAHATMLYPRDPSLDPQLVWKGKDEQDREDLPVPAVPIYIQEKIAPAGDHRRPARATAADRERRAAGLFADFNGTGDDFDQTVEFYQHEQHWSNRMILGDSLLVMTSLAEKEGLKGKVQTIYIDPPYGIKFGSNWQVRTRKRDVQGRQGTPTLLASRNRSAPSATPGSSASTRISSYLRDRLVVARELLTESGSVFVQIGDENVHLVRHCWTRCSGARTSCSSDCGCKKTSRSATGGIARGDICDYLLWYAEEHGANASIASSIRAKIRAPGRSTMDHGLRAQDG